MTFKRLFFLVSGILSFVAFLIYMIIPVANVNAIIINFDITLFEAIFGKELTIDFIEVTTSQILNFSILNLIGLLLSILAIAYAVVMVLDFRFFKARVDSIVAASLHLIAGIFGILVINFIVLTESSEGKGMIKMTSGPVIYLILNLIICILIIVTELFVPKKALSLTE